MTTLTDAFRNFSNALKNYFNKRADTPNEIQNHLGKSFITFASPLNILECNTL